MTENQTYFVHCRIDTAKHDQLLALRPKHLEHIIGYKERIAFAGVTGPPGGLPDGITLFIEAPSLDDARSIAAGDPYAAIYASVDVMPFQQRIPEVYPGALDDTLTKLRATAAQT